MTTTVQRLDSECPGARPQSHAVPTHSAARESFCLIGATKRGLIVIVSHTERGDTIRIISARRATRHESGRPMKKISKAKRTSDGMRVEYDFSGGVRGKYAARHCAGTNVVMLDPDGSHLQGRRGRQPGASGHYRCCAGSPPPAKIGQDSEHYARLTIRGVSGHGAPRGAGSPGGGRRAPHCWGRCLPWPAGAPGRWW